jgi:UDP-N-acetylglucosamine transferase subunit ALG13
MNGRYVLTSLTLLEDLFEDVATIRVWTMEDISTYRVKDFNKGYSTAKPMLVDEMPNQLGKVPVVVLYNQKSQRRGIGISDLNDVAELQKAIYNDYSEIEQLVRLSNHPSLVKTPNVEASAGAGSIIEMPEDLKPYLIQPSSQSLDGIMNNINMKVEAINRITHMGAVRATQDRVQSGIALQTEFQLLNARLSEKADYLQNAEEQIWKLFAEWQNQTFDGEIIYPDSFNLRDYASDLQFLQQAKASGVQSDSFLKEVDKQIARAVVDDDEKINTIDSEIDAKAITIGQFSTPTIEGEEVEEA